MEKIKIKYMSDKIERLRYIDGKSDWIDRRAAERVEPVSDTHLPSAQGNRAEGN